MRTWISAGVAAAVLAAIVMGPASADPIAGVSAFQGFASIGKVPGVCFKGASFTDPSGHGIGLLPAPFSSKPLDVQAYWRLRTTHLGTMVGSPSASQGPLFDVDMCGRLSSVLGVGAACGWNKGHSGIGVMRDNASNAVVAHFRNIGWKFTVGGTHLVTGVVQDSPKAKSGTLVGLMQAEGGAACFSPDKAQAYNVLGVFAYASGPGDADKVFWNRVTDPVDPKGDGPSGPTNPWGDKK